MVIRRNPRINPSDLRRQTDPKPWDIAAAPIPEIPDALVSAKQGGSPVFSYTSGVVLAGLRLRVIEEWDNSIKPLTLLTTEEWTTTGPPSMVVLTTEEWQHRPPAYSYVTIEIWQTAPPNFSTVTTEIWT